MTFAELLQKYKDGTATEEEIRLVEAELEKSEAINEYLGEKIEQLADWEDWEKEFTSDSKKIRGAVNRKLWKMVLLVLLILVLLGALLYYVALPLYNEQFYDPYEVAEGVPDLRVKTEENQGYYETFTPLHVNIEAFLDLHCPGWMLQNEKVEALGLGRYETHIEVITGHTVKEYTAMVDKGEIQQGINPEWFFPTPHMGRFFDKGSDHFVVTFVDENGNSTRKQQEDSRSRYREELQKLPESAVMTAYVSFDDNMTVEELLAWEKEIDTSVIWAAVESGENSSLSEVGFDVHMGGQILETTEEFDALFPYLDVNSVNSKDAEDMAAIYEQHYKSLLNYMSYQEDFLHAFCTVNSYDSTSAYREALAYAEEQGVQIYGAVLSGSRDAMLQLEQRNEINSFLIDDVRLSQYS